VYFRFPQQYVAVLNLFLIGIIVYFLALAVSNGIKLRLAKADLAHFSEVQRPQHSNPQQAELQPRPYYDAIVRRDIFNRAPVVVPPPPPVENENLNITLIGTSHLSIGKPFIIVETSAGDQNLYRLGETIPNVGRVLSISHNRAVVLHNGHRVVLKIPSPGEGDVPEPLPLPWSQRRLMRSPRFGPGRYRYPLRAPGALSSNSEVQQLSPDRYVVGRAAVDRSLGNMGALFRQIRAAPNIQNGSSNGFRLSQIQPGSIFQQIGLQDGDIVTGAQGQQVNNPLQAMALLNALRNSPSISLSLIRNGSPMQLYYTIH
jgi:type II secretion system protein C